MKKTHILGIALVLVFLVTTAYAGFPKVNTGSAVTNAVVNTTVSAAKNKALEADMNKKLRSFNCAFKDGSTATTCNLNSVASYIRSKDSSLRAFGLAKVYVNIKASGTSSTAYKRSSHVRDVLYGQMNWWHYNVRSVKDNTNKLSIWVEVRD